MTELLTGVWRGGLKLLAPILGLASILGSIIAILLLVNRVLNGTLFTSSETITAVGVLLLSVGTVFGAMQVSDMVDRKLRG